MLSLHRSYTVSQRHTANYGNVPATSSCVVHWVSVAHHYLRIPLIAANQTLPDGDPAVVPHVEVFFASHGVRIDFEDFELTANADLLVLSAMTYPCRGHMPLDNIGRRILHTVGIMIGPVPMVTKRDGQPPESLDSLLSVWKCDECNTPGCAHSNAESIYEIERVLQLAPCAGVSLVKDARYDPLCNPN